MSRCQVCGKPFSETEHRCPHCRALVCSSCGDTYPPASVVCLRCNILLSGVTLQDRYQIELLIGKGGMGAVYRASMIRAGRRPCAVKEMLAPSLPRGEDAGTSTRVRFKQAEAHFDRARQLFEKEVQILSQLEHPGIPRVHDFFEDHRRYYFVMEFIEGTSLQAIVARSDSFLSEPRVLGWATEICDILAHLHSQQPFPVVHRDVKPQNLMLAKDTHGRERLKLVDFGIARRFKGGLSRDTDYAGALAFAAPEQMGLVQSESSPRTDVYSLGATIYYLLTNRRGEVDNYLSSGDKGISGLPHPAISPGLEIVLRKAVAWYPSRRFRSAADMRQALVGVGAQPEPRQKPTQQPLDPERLKAAGEPTAAAYLSRGKALIAQRRWGDAIQELTDAISLNRSSGEAYKARGIAYTQNGDHAAAIGDYDQALKLGVGDAAVYLNRGIAHYHLGNQLGALGDLSKAIGANPSAIAAYRYRGLVYRTQGQINKAKQDFEKVVRLGGNSELATEAKSYLRDLRARSPSLGSRLLQSIKSRPILSSLAIGGVILACILVPSLLSGAGGQTGGTPIPPTATPTVPSPTYYETFSGGGGGWDDNEFEDGSTARTENGMYHIRVKGQPGYHSWGIRRVEEHGDLILEVDARQVDGQNNNGYGLFLRVTGMADDIEKGYVFLISGDGEFCLGKVTGGQFSYIKNWSPSSAIHQGGTTNRLKVVARGDMLELHANGKLLDTATDDSFAAGTIGLTAVAYEESPYTGSDAVHVAFDNVKVYSLGPATSVATFTPTAFAPTDTHTETPTPTLTSTPTTTRTPAPTATHTPTSTSTPSPIPFVCPPDPSLMQIENHLEVPLSISLSGPWIVTVRVPAGATRYFCFMPGQYAYRATATGYPENSGTIALGTGPCTCWWVYPEDQVPPSRFTMLAIPGFVPGDPVIVCWCPAIEFYSPP